MVFITVSKLQSTERVTTILTSDYYTVLELRRKRSKAINYSSSAFLSWLLCGSPGIV